MNTAIFTFCSRHQFPGA